MVFFQAALLAGYAYAHATTTWLGVADRRLSRLGCSCSPLFVLPFGIPPDAARSLSPEANPTGWLFLLLLGMVALPFFVVSTSAPLLQRWFTQTGHPAAADPYFLYGASNLGSMLALLAYPLVIEPNLRLAQQSMAWTVGYGLYVMLVLGCVTVVWRGQERAAAGPDNPGPTREIHRLGIGQVSRWVALAFIPTSLMLGVTMDLTTDIAAIPLLGSFPWALPADVHTDFRPAADSRSFVDGPGIADGRGHARPDPEYLVDRAADLPATSPGGLLPRRDGLSWRTRAVPSPPGHLTAFYLAMSCGGVLGGLFNALIAPLVFDRIVEYPCGHRPGLSRPAQNANRCQRSLEPLAGLDPSGVPRDPDVGPGHLTATPLGIITGRPSR